MLTKFRCSKSNVDLCVDPCFRVYHTQLHFLRVSDTTLGKQNTKFKTVILLYYYYQRARNVTASKFDKCLHFISIFIARKLIVGMTIRYVSLNNT
jgi:hypothetical protein